MTVEYNTCEGCGACDGRAGTLISSPSVLGGKNLCLNCRETIKSGNVTFNLSLSRSIEERRRIIALLMEVGTADVAATAFMADIAAELHRARTKFPGRRLMSIALAEEFGELMKAMLDESAGNVRKEAIQVAVMAIRVAIDGDESVDEWRAKKGLDFVGTRP